MEQTQELEKPNQEAESNSAHCWERARQLGGAILPYAGDSSNVESKDALEMNTSRYINTIIPCGKFRLCSLVVKR